MKNYNFVLIFWMAVGLLTACAPDLPRNQFYVDALRGNDHFSGHSPDAAWKSLDAVNVHRFHSGDRLFFKAGTSYTGQLVLHGSGSADAPVKISRYGSGKDPLIQGNGQKNYTLLLRNVSYYEVRHLKITNHGDSRKPNRTGVLLEADNYGDMTHIVLDSLEVADVNGSLVKKKGGGSAIFWRNHGDSVLSRFVDLKIEYCYLHDCGRNGIGSTGNAGRDRWFPSKKVLIDHNLLERIPGDGIVPIGCDSAIIEYNTMRLCPDSLSPDEAAAGIWPWSSDHTLIQFNEVSGHKAKWDGQGFDADYNCFGTVLRYNYSHDNYGGFLLVCNDGSSLGKPWNHGTRNSRICFNLSVNDGIRPYPTRQEGWFAPVFQHNLIVIPQRKMEEDKPVVVAMGNWGNQWPRTMKILGNTICSVQQPIYWWKKASSFSFKKNDEKILTHYSASVVIEQLDRLIQQSDSADREGYSRLKQFVLPRLRGQVIN